MKIGTLLKLIRTRKNFNQIKMADLLGISQNYLSLIELGYKYPTLDRIEDFARRLKISKEAIHFAIIDVPRELDAKDSLVFYKLQKSILSKMVLDQVMENLFS